MNSVKMKERNFDIFSGKDDLEPLYTMKHFPIYMGAAMHSPENDLYADMEWAISKGSGMIQLKKLIPNEILYKDSHNSSIGTVWKEHHTKFAELLHSNIDTESITEIGGGNGILNSIYTQKYGHINWTIIEPSNVMPVAGCDALYIRKLWGNENFKQANESIPVECLVHSHVIEHLYDLESFMKQNEQMLNDGQKMIFSVPNLKETFKKKYTNALNFEHTYFISEDYIEESLNNHSFSIIDKQYFKSDHSIFYVTEKMNNIKKKITKKHDDLYYENKILFEQYIEYYQKLIEEINYKIKNVKQPVYLFGAHIFSQYLIYFGLDTANIKCILDNDAMKQGKRLYGTSLNISSPKILANEMKPVVILKAANYTDEIKQDIIRNINADTIFLE